GRPAIVWAAREGWRAGGERLFRHRGPHTLQPRTIARTSPGQGRQCMRRVQRSVASVAVAVVLVLFAGGRPAPVQSQTGPRKLDLAHIIAPPESGAIGFKYLAEEGTKRSNGQLNVVFHGGTLLGKELEIMDAVKSGNIAIGTPVGAACTVFPEMCVFLTPYLVRDYNHAYSMFNGEIGKTLDETFQKKYKVKILFFYDYGFRHFWNNRKPINSPAD